MEAMRGSDKLRAAWEQRQLTEESVSEIADALAESPASVDAVEFHGGGKPTGVSISLSYSGDDIDRCGNDIISWIKWSRRYGTTLARPILIDGVWPEILQVTLPFGQVERLNVGQELPGR